MFFRYIFIKIRKNFNKKKVSLQLHKTIEMKDKDLNQIKAVLNKKYSHVVH